ncbi:MULTISPECIES: hypothetical protein [Burkholderiales]|uniref:hypothetical protein n=1 Tax=Burkholderiales TaxID=80840 RepID=UPI001E409259|nr:hypothetical protein [Achromobacter sp. 2789STDY5608615]MCG2598242.1 hypothetical protein [Achromobacter sp.]MCG2602357.1 hypothetical protein [Achromobacter sp.]
MSAFFSVGRISAAAYPLEKATSPKWLSWLLPAFHTPAPPIRLDRAGTFVRLCSVDFYTQLAYILMKALFVELPAFSRHRTDYLDDDGFHALQQAMMQRPEAGDVIEGTGGLRKLRFGDPRRGKGKRGGLRVIYYWWDGRSQFWLFTLYDKDEMNDLTARDRKLLKSMLEAEREARR